MQDLLVVYKDFLQNIAQNEYFIYVVASMAFCGICGLIISIFRSDSV